ncbi:MAG TPA: GAF and ANTAR domain-containing protein [Jatrophihabitans sp.]|nr:GAF and ANTAR domain-containing protein [Jatrophihabitans sp.]
MADSLENSHLFARIARDLAEQPDQEQTTRRIVELGHQLTGCDVAALWQLSPTGAMTLLAVTDPVAGQTLNQVYAGIQEGPVHEALTRRATIHARDLDTEARWPLYLGALQARELPIGSVIAYELELGGHQLGALALYANQPRFFTEELYGIGSVLADHAAIALETVALADNNHHLKEALQSNRRIGMAIGIMMALHRIGEQQAFDILRIASQHTHIKLRDVAEEVILTGATPEWQARQPVRFGQLSESMAGKLADGRAPA